MRVLEKVEQEENFMRLVYQNIQKRENIKQIGRLQQSKTTIEGS